MPIDVSNDSAAGSRFVRLRDGGARPDDATVVVVGASARLAARVVAVLGTLGARFAGESAVAAKGAGRRVVVVEEAGGRLGPRTLRRFRAPRLVVVSHDPVLLAEELGATDGDGRRGILRAKRRLDVALRLAITSDCPALLLGYDLARGPAADLAAVVAPFCGLDVPAEPPAWSDAPATAGEGIVSLAAARRPPRGDGRRTIIVGGPPRSGTSMIAAALHAAGLPLGDLLTPSTFENAPQNRLFKTSVPRSWRGALRGSWKAALRNPRHARLAWDGFDVPGIAALVAERQRDGAIWGFKRPGIGSFIRLGGLDLLDGPQLVMSLRDPVAIAIRIARAHGLAIDVALPMARFYLLDSLATALACQAPTLLLSHRALGRDLPALFERLFTFCGLAIERTRYDAIAAAVVRSGELYVKDFAAPIVGEIMDVVDDNLRGWVEGDGGAPVHLDVFADDRQVASGLADEVLDGEGRLFFKVPLPSEAVADSARIRAVIASTSTELRNSGFTRAELEQELVILRDRS